MIKIALVVGHKKSSPGACYTFPEKYNRKPLTEFEFNNKLACDIERKFKSDNIVEGTVELQVIHRRTYLSLPQDINEYGPTFIVSMHCNAYNGKVSGTEVLYYHKSKKGKVLADIFNQNFVKYLGLPDRGIKPRSSEDAGGYFLRYTNAPAIIAEPFFIDNPNDLKIALSDNREKLIDAYLVSLTAAVIGVNKGIL